MKVSLRNNLLIFHTLPAAAALSKLNVDAARGLRGDEARKRLQKFGPNELVVIKRVSPFVLFLKQFKNVLIIILLVAATLTGFLGNTTEAATIGAIIVLAAVLGFVQEFRAERALEALRELSAPLALVVRDGREIDIPARELAPGDIILLATGDRVPADARLIEAINLKALEATLTGESAPGEKHSDRLCPAEAAVGDRHNMIFAGTSITYGRGQAVVVATGSETEFGHIAQMLRTVPRTDTPLQKNLHRLGASLTKVALLMVAIIVVLGVLHGQPFLEMLVFGIALAVAVVPEALPAAVTISLALGVQRMAKRHALIRHLPAVETLGSTTIICTDKTGTLTKDEMTARKILLSSGEVLDITGSGYEPTGVFLFQNTPFHPTEILKLLLTAGALASDARLTASDGTWNLKGDPTEAALVVAAHKAGLKKELLDEEYRRIAEIPFTSETKRMITLNQNALGTAAYAKGAIEVILASSLYYQGATGTQPLTEKKRQEILVTAQAFAGEALRVIAVAYAPVSSLEAAEHGLTFLGLVGMIDPPRPEAKAAIAACHKAGIKIMMITGDHPATAEAIARELTILPPGGRVVTGAELAAMNETELEHSIENIAVCARVSPEHKLRIVETLKKRGHIVAMTGDGINDAPALKAADIGIAMGRTGTDVSKEAAAMVLTDDNFASIVAAIEEGRIIFSNIKKFLTYLVSSNLGEIGLIAVASFLSMPLPLSAIQILFINLASDGLPALALGVDPPEKDGMERLPRKLSAGFFSRSVVALMTVGGLWSTLTTIGLFLWAREAGRGLTYSMTMVFVALVLIQFLKTYAFRSDTHSVFNHPFSNWWLNGAILIELLLLAALLYLPFWQRIFSLAILSFSDLMIVAGAALLIIPILEMTKLALHKLKKPGTAPRLSDKITA
ncbi:MAG: cation-translocating P-type ATPase [Candidatus Magasanikbacteria bacterium]|nr:cation-translocating P-type ATPase [Candidatus Magasanikbacteria bacterium]